MSAAAVRKPPGVEVRPHLTPRVAFSLASATFLLAGVLSSTAITIAAPFEHGWRLVAYLSLVGALSRLLLGVGQSLLAENAGQSGSSRLVGLDAGAVGPRDHRGVEELS
jgi:hypothetical protein